MPCSAHTLFLAGCSAAFLSCSVNAGKPSAIPTSADVAGDGDTQIGTINVNPDDGPGETFMDATFELDDDYAYLDEWYNFRWINVQISFTHNGVPVDSDGDGDPDNPNLGDLPAIDPAPEGYGNGDDDKPFYETDEEFEDTHVEGESSNFTDSRSSSAAGTWVRTFRTYLVVESVTDSAIPANTFCVLAGFEWTSTVVDGAESDEQQTTSIPNPGAEHIDQINDALDQAPGDGFPGWDATGDCELNACISYYCPWDCVPIGGDTFVNVDDLLGVINAWGSSHPRFDFAPPGGDNVVAVDDMLALINNWGGCPIISGACCLPSGECMFDTQAVCLSMGGVYQGDDVSCSHTFCVTAPPNDLCINAIHAFPGTNIWNNIDANTDGPTACAEMSRDVWFDLTAPCTGLIHINTLGTPPPFVDTMLQVFAGSQCNPLGPELACNDDIDNPNGNLLSSVTIQAFAGQQLKIRCGSWGGDPTNQGQAMLNIQCSGQ